MGVYLGADHIFYLVAGMNLTTDWVITAGVRDFFQFLGDKCSITFSDFPLMLVQKIVNNSFSSSFGSLVSKTVFKMVISLTVYVATRTKTTGFLARNLLRKIQEVNTLINRLVDFIEISFIVDKMGKTDPIWGKVLYATTIKVMF